MAKPICVIYFPDKFTERTKRDWIYDYMFFLNGEKREGAPDWGDASKWGDYHWFCFYKYDIEEPEFHVFYEKDFTPIKFQELKELVISSINSVANQDENK